MSETKRRPILTLGGLKQPPPSPEAIVQEQCKPSWRVRKAARDENAAAVRHLILVAFPVAFDAQGPKPLALGIHEAIQAALPDHPHVQIHDFLAWWTTRNRYLSAVAAGGPRYGLDGKPGAEVSEEHQRIAAGMLAKRLKNAA